MTTPTTFDAVLRAFQPEDYGITLGELLSNADIEAIKQAFSQYVIKEDAPLNSSTSDIWVALRTQNILRAAMRRALYGTTNEEQQ
ncbi:hypothetical protein E3O44_12525 [Cryobacterium algoricola]|uniref:Uncharacterized protein n=1 Tax=Cryobacterium algoricola TaxID=1259183 RepID=A0ABY2ID48_9MICO|nr:hypothetical protein [Cryobacterium algoricola]TFB85820.1 hypothetical protein E3O44_12525 [Cryobacterium algoricola]